MHFDGVGHEVDGACCVCGVVPSGAVVWLMPVLFCEFFGGVSHCLFEEGELSDRVKFFDKMEFVGRGVLERGLFLVEKVFVISVNLLAPVGVFQVV